MCIHGSTSRAHAHFARTTYDLLATTLYGGAFSDGEVFTGVLRQRGCSGSQGRPRPRGRYIYIYVYLYTLCYMYIYVYR